ncbi:leucyl aminopeptidase [Microlunatus aurantiacus]|uniref:Probable cytosol aminopeptidase n=1 Tax=Microlunatus aurantiacus TaxID=446786 RepID=A0ABP7DTE1_9ACTN
MPVPSLPTLTVARTPDKTATALVVGYGAAGVVGAPSGLDKEYSKRLGLELSALAASIGAKTDAGHTRTLPAVGGWPVVIVVGLGEESPTPEDLRQAAGAGVKQAAKQTDGGAHVAVALGADEPETVQAVAEGALLGSYGYRPNGQGDKPAAVASVSVITPLAGRRVSTTEAVTSAATIAQAVAAAREWVNIPPNLLYPASFAEEAKAFLRDSKVAVEVLDDKALAKGGYGGILAVGGGSSRPPRLVRLAYSPRGAKHHLALVGKGITFDSGGLNLKPGDSMYTMKCDMAGAAAVIAAVRAIADLGLRVKVTAYASLAENLPSDTAYRPSDVLTMYGGKTVENGNTDAEGRLVMADAIARASEDAPDLIVDVATLTGAAVVALGDRTAGLMASDDDTADRVLDAAEAAGEDVWQLPIPKHIRPKLDSKVADIRSTSGERSGGALVAAAFLREFVGEGVAWAHVDIAGPAWTDGGGSGYVSPGGTGFGVRTLVALARSLED